MMNNHPNDLTYTQLCELLEDNLIDWSTWIEAQGETYAGYNQWLTDNGLERNDENAHRYITLLEEAMDAQTTNEFQNIYNSVQYSKNIIAGV